MSMMVCVPAFAASSNGSDNLNGIKIKLYDLYVKTDYDPSQVILERHQSDSEVSVAVKEKQTGNVLKVFGEMIPSKAEKNTLHTTDEGQYFDRYVYTNVSAGPATARLIAVLRMYSWDSFAEIETVKDMYWQRYNGGIWDLEDAHTDWSMQHTPGTTVDLSGTAVVSVDITQSTTGSFSIKALESFGYSISQTSGTTYHARHPIFAEFGYSVY